LTNGHCALVGLAILGALMIAFSVTIRLRGTGDADQRAEPRIAWSFVLRSPNFWIGTALLLRAIYKPAGEVLLVALAIVAFVITAVVVAKLAARLTRGAVSLPTTWRRIGDPSEWKGKV
jgi:hypothetical protein